MNSKPPVPPKAEKWYQGYSAHDTDEQARAAFAAKFGRGPEELHRTGGSVNVGPLWPEEMK